MNKLFLKFALVGLIITLFTSCGGGLQGTYVAKNDAAKQSMFAKFVFKGNKVKVIMGVPGIEMPGGYEYGFSRKGNRVKIEMKVMGTSMGSIDLEYNEDTDELRLLFGGETGKDINQHAPIWVKEGRKETPVQKHKKGFWGKIIYFVRRILGGKDDKQDNSLVIDPDTVQQDNPLVIDPDTVQVVSPDGISLNNSSLSFGKKGETAQLIATVTPENAANKQITWESSDEKVAKVEDNGDNTADVTAGVNGTAIVTAEIDGVRESCVVTVEQQHIVPRPSSRLSSIDKLNNLLNSIANSNDAARDEMSKLNRVRVDGAAHISNVQQLITEVSNNGTRYTVTNVQTDDDGKVVSITVSK
jgi:uncharacterized protein YjdB